MIAFFSVIHIVALELDDPYGELPIAENRDAKRDDVATDFNAVYWETRFAPRPHEAAGGVLKAKRARPASFLPERKSVAVTA